MRPPLVRQVEQKVRSMCSQIWPPKLTLEEIEARQKYPPGLPPDDLSTDEMLRRLMLTRRPFRLHVWQGGPRGPDGLPWFQVNLHNAKDDSWNIQHGADPVREVRAVLYNMLRSYG